MAYPEPFKVTLKDGVVTLSVKVSDESVIVRECTESEFDLLVAQYESQKGEEE